MRWLKARDAARYAGGVSTKLLYAEVRAGRLKAAHIGAGRNLMFCDWWIDEWLAGEHVHDSAPRGGTREAPGDNNVRDQSADSTATRPH